MMRKILFDASVYIQALRSERSELLAARTRGAAHVYLFAVVGSELLRGARDAHAERIIRKLWRDAEKAGRLVVPSTGDWHDAGLILGKLAAKYGYESLGQAKLLHDVLIAVAARRHGIAVFTINVADFERIREFRSFQLFPA